MIGCYGIISSLIYFGLLLVVVTIGIGFGSLGLMDRANAGLSCLSILFNIINYNYNNNIKIHLF